MRNLLDSLFYVVFWILQYLIGDVLEHLSLHLPPHHPSGPQNPIGRLICIWVCGSHCLQGVEVSGAGDDQKQTGWVGTKVEIVD